MRILHVYRTYFPDSQGGLEEVIRQICLNAKQHGVESRVFTLSRVARPEPIEREEARVFQAQQTLELASCGMSVSALSAFKTQIEWADVIHYHYPWPFADVLHLASKVAKPTLVTYHSDIVRQKLLGHIYRPLMNRFLGDVDRIICTSPNYFATSDVLSSFSKKVDVIPIGLTESSYPTPSTKKTEEVRSAFGSDFFLFVGVLRYYKGLHILLDAAQNADLRVVIAGSGPTETDLKKQAKDLGLRNVIFAGQVDDETKVSLFHLARAVVFPSYLRSEAFGVTLLEGAMYGKPLISTEVGSGTSHVNIDKETGYVVTPGSASELRRVMRTLKNNTSAAEHFGKNARARYTQLFTGELMGARYAEVYNQLAPTAQPQAHTPTASHQNVRQIS